MNLRQKHNQGNSILLVTVIVLVGMVLSVSFFQRSASFLNLVGWRNDGNSSQYQMESAYEVAKAKIERAMDGATLAGKLRYVNAATSLTTSGETFATIASIYGTDANGDGSALDEALLFLEDMVRAQAYSSAGTLDTAHEFGQAFTDIFPDDWEDPDLSDSNYSEVKYTFTPVRVEMELATEPQSIRFEYEYRIQVRGYGNNRYSKTESEDAGVIAISIDGTPFSRWGLFANSLQNQNGNFTAFIGGDTSSTINEVYEGPVHVNGVPVFYGHPTFNGPFSSATDSATWVYLDGTDYSGCAGHCPTFNDGSSVVSSIDIPMSNYHLARMAAGDTSDTAATNDATPSLANLKTYLATYAGGTVDSGAASIPTGIYVPIDASSRPKGGIYVEGDARIVLNVVQGSSDFVAAEWANIAADDQSCKFQKIAITSTTSGVTPRDIYIADEPCNSTYVFDSSSPATAPVILSGRPNGLIHVNGKIDELGGESRTRPAVAADFGLTVSATKDVRIINDLQYEDAQYVTLGSDGSLGSTVVADPTGSTGDPTQADLAATIDDDSTTTLGIVSLERNVLIHTSAPANLNLHGAIYAASSSAYSAGTGYGCGTAGDSTQGCGFGFESYDTATGLGQLKLFGGVAQYKGQTLGILNGATQTGYLNKQVYDPRLESSISPPAYPVTNTPQAFGSIKSYKTWRVSQAN